MTITYLTVKGYVATVKCSSDKADRVTKVLEKHYKILAYKD